LPRLKLTNELRARLKSPLGELLKGTPDENMRRVLEAIEREKPKRIICVGDVVSRNAIKAGVPVDVRVIDNRIMRKNTEPMKIEAKRILYAKNPPGMLDLTAWQALSEAIERGDSLMVVEGEEDLLTMAAIAEAPVVSIVIYGQPEEGIVVVRVDEKKKREIRAIIDAMMKE